MGRGKRGVCDEKLSYFYRLVKIKIETEEWILD
jgi:hypothetical protein